MRFLFRSKLPIHYKFSSTAYIFSYYAIACAVPLTILNYVMLGVLDLQTLSAYLPSWQTQVSLLVVFGLAAPFALAILRYRSGQAGLMHALLTQVRRRFPHFSC